MVGNGCIGPVNWSCAKPCVWPFIGIMSPCAAAPPARARTPATARARERASSARRRPYHTRFSLSSSRCKLGFVFSSDPAAVPGLGPGRPFPSGSRSSSGSGIAGSRLRSPLDRPSGPRSPGVSSTLGTSTIWAIAAHPPPPQKNTPGFQPPPPPAPPPPPPPTPPPPPRPDQVAFRALYKELVETNTTASVSCTLAAQRMAAHLKAAGFPDSDLTVFTAPGYPKNGGLVAVFPGKDPKAKAILLLATSTWSRPSARTGRAIPSPWSRRAATSTARGAADDKALAAIWVDTLIRYQDRGLQSEAHDQAGADLRRGRRPPLQRRLVAGAEPARADRRRAFALNEGAGGQLDDHGKRIAHTIEAGEKTPQSFKLEVTNPGGHSSLPVPDNAIYQLADAIEKIRAYEFPVHFNDTNRAYFEQMARGCARRGGPGHGGAGRQPQGRPRRRDPVEGPWPAHHAAHHLRGHHAVGRPRRERAAPARHRQHQLPHLPGRQPRGACAPS